MSDFKVGDVVKLKSGGDKMTIVCIIHTGQGKDGQGKMMRCAWQHGSSKEILDNSFPPDALQKAESE